MKKTYLSVFLVMLLMLLPMLSTKAFADDTITKLSPAFDVIAAKQTMVKGGVVRENVQFTETDFKQCLGVSKLDYIKVTKAPDETDGVLSVGSMTVKSGQKIDASLLSMLKFVPSSESIETASFSFCGDEATSGTEIKCKLRIGEKVNYAPTIAAVENTYAQIKAESGKPAASTLTATDPEGDKLSYEIISYPAHGTVNITDTATGAFSYTSYSNFRGEDSFVYVARDDWGNYTTPSTVSISVY